jgi:hypothetical protein
MCKRSGIAVGQGDQIGKIFAIWAIFLASGEYFIEKIAQ